MQPITIQRQVQATGVISSSMFGIGNGAEAHLFGILRNSLYTDKPLAILREYSTNAWDAHQDAGIPDKPIYVALPTDIEPTLVIRDYGLGLSETQIRNVYAMYGASTKRQSNRSIGYKGIGSKSAFAYADMFTITSYHQGIRTVYNALLDATNIGQVDKVFEALCRDDQTGIEIRIPIQPKDIPAFHRAAQSLFPFFTPLPTINIPITSKVAQQGYLNNEGSGWIAVMGVVPYILDFSKMQDEIKNLHDIVSATSGVLFFDIGEVSVSASREELEYTNATKAAVVRRVEELFAEQLSNMDQITNDPDVSPWDKRLHVKQFLTTSQWPVAPRYLPWSEQTVAIKHPTAKKTGDGNLILGLASTRSFRIWSLVRSHRTSAMTWQHSDTPNILVDSNTRFIIKDTKRPFRYLGLTEYDYVVTPRDRIKVDAVKKDLAALIDAAQISGIPVVMLSAIDTTVLKTTSHRTTNPKHSTAVSCFVLRGGVKSSTLSDYWDITKRIPEVDDVFVRLSGFAPIEGGSGRDFYRVIRSDQAIINLLGGVFPPVYGYKSTAASKPLADIPGTSYADWRISYIRSLLSQAPRIQEDVEAYRWAKAFGWGSISDNKAERLAERWAVHLGSDHIIPQFLHTSAAAIRRLQKVTHKAQIEQLISIVESPDTALAARSHILARYPLLESQHYMFDVVQHIKSAAWVEYINAIDQVKP